MNIDFHTHGNLSKKIPVTLEQFEEKMKEAKLNGLNAIALTEHFNAVNFQEMYDMLDEHFVYTHHYYSVNGIKVFPGIEIDVKETGHFLAVADRTTIRAIHHALFHHQEEDQFIGVSDLLDLLEEYEVLKIGAHPYRESTPWVHHSEDILRKFDAFDINGKDLYKYGMTMKEKVTELAEEMEISAVGGSDTHQFLQYGSIYNEMIECNTIAELKEAVLNNRYKVKISSSLEMQVKAANLVKKLLKSESVAVS